MMITIPSTQVTNSPPEFLRPFGSKPAELERGQGQDSSRNFCAFELKNLEVSILFLIFVAEIRKQA